MCDRHEEKAERIVRARDAMFASIAAKEQRPERDVKDGAWLMHEIATALASAESDLIKRMMEPSLPSEAMRLAANRVWSGGRSEWWPLKIETVSEAWLAMLRAFAKENNIDLEGE